jgi:hypothetical protein
VLAYRGGMTEQKPLVLAEHVRKTQGSMGFGHHGTVLVIDLDPQGNAGKHGAAHAHAGQSPAVAALVADAMHYDLIISGPDGETITV